MKKYLTKDAFRRFLPALLSGIAMTAAICLGLNWFLRHIGWMIATFGEDLGLRRTKAKQFSKIFSQLEEASISFPLLLTFVLCLAVAYLGRRLIRKGKALRIIGAVLLCFFLFLAVLILTLLLTHVNGLQFYLVLKQLIMAAQSGVL